MANTRPVVTFNVDDSAAQDEITSTEETSQGEQSTQPAAPSDSEMTAGLLVPADGADSLVQPGRPVFDSQLPPELSGSLATSKDMNLEDRGQYADIFVGVWKQPDGSKTTVAIKCVRRDSTVDLKRLKMRIRREAVIWQAANHPNILEFIGYKVVDGLPWLVSPWCRHRNLSVYITKKEGITKADILKLLCDAAHGLQHLHKLTPLIVHGDIKPANVIVKDNLEAALCDFGVSRVFLAAGTPTGLTTTGNSMGGTAGYQSLELLEGKSPPTTYGDVYAFGGLILAAMSGKQPFHKKKNDAARIVAVCQGELPEPKDHRGLPKNDPLWELLWKCWNNVPEERPSMETILEQLEVERQNRSPSASSSA